MRRVAMKIERPAGADLGEFPFGKGALMPGTRLPLFALDLAAGGPRGYVLHAVTAFADSVAAAAKFVKVFRTGESW